MKHANHNIERGPNFGDRSIYLASAVNWFFFFSFFLSCFRVFRGEVFLFSICSPSASSALLRCNSLFLLWFAFSLFCLRPFTWSAEIALHHAKSCWFTRSYIYLCPSVVNSLCFLSAFICLPRRSSFSSRTKSGVNLQKISKSRLV